MTIALRDGHACFLEEAEWQEVLMTPRENSALFAEWSDTWQVLPLMCFIPGLLNQCREVLRNSSPGSIKRVADSTQALREKFLQLAKENDWESSKYLPVLAPRNVGDDLRLFCDHDDQRAANYGNFLSGLAVINRIILALRPSMWELEFETCTRAIEIQHLHSFIKSTSWLRKIYLVHSERVALAILSTTDLWTGPRDNQGPPAYDAGVVDGGRLIESWKFDVFDDILRARKGDAALM
jgi:hypothetical protein